MSLPWEQANIEPNLETLSRLRRGDHLSVLKEGENTEGEYVLGDRGLRAHFKIQGKFKQSFVRSKKGESILDDDQYKKPLIRFFRAAVGEWGRHQVTGDLVSNALRGLESLRQTYVKDDARRGKMDEIIEAVRREMRGIRVEGVFLDPDDRHQIVLGSQSFPGLRQRLFEIVTDISGSGMVEEYERGVNKDFLDAVYGENAKPQKATTMPLGDLSYVRKSMGVCRQFHRDCHEGSGVYLKGVAKTCSKTDLHELFEYLNRDEGLLFAVSQLATQGAVTGAAAVLFGQGGRDGQAKVPLIQSGGERVMISMGGGHCDILKRGNQIVVINEQQYDGNNQAFPVDHETGMGEAKTLSHFGITRIDFRVSVRLWRTGDRIELAMNEWTLRITTA